MNVQIDNITEGQAFAIMDLLALWAELGEKSASRWVSLYADGANSFKPTVTVDGEAPVRCGIGTLNRWHTVYFLNPEGEYEPETMYFLDPAQIEGSLRVLREGESPDEDHEKDPD